MQETQKILRTGSLLEKKALFQFKWGEPVDKILLKFNLWSRHFFPQYFQDEDAPFHDDMNELNIKVHQGLIESFVNIAFRGAGKDVKTKLFIPFCILNDLDRSRRFFKILSADLDNAKQSATDIYNMLINPRVVEMYPDTFEKSIYKREETMQSFTTATSIKVLADSIGTEQRGAIQEEARPDFIWFNDFETRKTLRSAIITRSIWDNMEEARTSLQKGGGCVYTCNYISEMGNVHKLVTEKVNDMKQVMITPILDRYNKPNWKRYTIEEIESMRKNDDDFEGERMCKPSASLDVLFDRDTLEQMPVLIPKREIAGFKIFKNYDPSHRYASGHDVAGGVGLDSSTSVFIDFDTFPAQVVATFRNNLIKPETFGDEVYNQTNKFGECLAAIENNKYDQAVLKAKLLGVNLYKTKGKETKINVTPAQTYGWNTNKLTKPKMLFSFAKAVSDGYIQLNDPDLIQEAMSYSRNDLIDDEEDSRLTTRHFDLLIAACIAWQMKDHSYTKIKSNYVVTSEEETNPAL